jgi:hypothetical protein
MDELNPIGTNDLNSQGDVQINPADLPSLNELGQESVAEFALPEDSNSRTKEQFEKLLKRNKELNEKIVSLEKETKTENKPSYNSVYDSFKSDKNAQINPESDYVTEDGEVDIQKLNADLKALKVSALEARRLAEQAREEVEAKEAHMKHPYLNPTHKEFDPHFFEFVKDRVLRQKYHEGKNITLTEVADQVLSFYKPSTVVKKENERIEMESKKTQNQILSNAPVSASNGRREPTVDLNDLRNKTLNGSQSALDARLKLLGIIK